MSNVQRELIREQLGVHPRAATNRLDRQLLYKYVKLAGDHYCFKCGEEIHTIEEFSVEHMKPWLNKDAKLFWDLDNIAFSHRRCNRPHNYGRGGVSQRKVSDDPDKEWCIGCKDFVARNLFHKSSIHWNGVQKYCVSCKRDMRKRSK